jgi:hypothetical protein
MEQSVQNRTPVSFKVSCGATALSPRPGVAEAAGAVDSDLSSPGGQAAAAAWLTPVRRGAPARSACAGGRERRATRRPEQPAPPMLGVRQSCPQGIPPPGRDRSQDVLSIQSERLPPHLRFADHRQPCSSQPVQAQLDAGMWRSRTAPGFYWGSWLSCRPVGGPREVAGRGRIWRAR